MAFKKNITSDTGIEVENAYIKVIHYSCDNSNRVQATLAAYVSQQSANEGKSYLEGSLDTVVVENVDYNDAASNAKKQIYNFAKTLPKYVNATDV